MTSVTTLSTASSINDDDDNPGTTVSVPSPSSITGSPTVSLAPIIAESESKENSEVTNNPDFNKLFDDILAFSFEILKYKISNTLELQSVGGSSIIRNYLENYNTIYKKSRRSHKHVVQIQEVWQKCKPHLIYAKDDLGIILRDEPDLDGFVYWLEKNSLVIAPPTDNPKAKIMVSAIFDNALKITKNLMLKAEVLEKQNKKDEANKIYDSPAIHYSNTFLLLLFRLFQFDTHKITTENGEVKPQIFYNPVEILTSSIRKLERTLGIDENETLGAASGIEDLLGAAGELASSLGMELPEEMNLKGNPLKGASKNSMKNALKEINNRPELKGMMQGLFSGMNPKDPTSITNTLNKLMTTMGQNQGMPEAVQRAMSATSSMNSTSSQTPATSSTTLATVPNSQLSLPTLNLTPTSK